MSAAAVCLGTPYRGDDAIGPLAGERLRSAGVRVLECGDEPTRLIADWSGLDTLVVVDAVVAGGPPGTLHRIEAVDEPLPADTRLASTHAVGISDAIQLGRTLGKAPRRVVLLAVEGQAFGMGDAMAPAVAAALEPLVAAALAELEEAACTNTR